MTLGALAAAGAPLATVSRRLEALEVPFELCTQEVEAGGVRALRVTVEHPEQRAHRTFADVRRLVEEAGLPGRITRRAIATFRLLAEAEGVVHGITPKDVTFHEVGAVDSILDVVGSCVALELLEAE